MNFKMGYNNAIDDADLSGTSISHVLLPVNNLKTLQRSKVFRCTASQVITGNFSGIFAIGVVAIWRSTLVGSWSFTLYSGLGQTGSILETQSNISDNAIWFDSVNALSFKVQFSGAGTFDLSRLFMGNVFSPVHNFDRGVSIAFNDTTDQQRTAGGSVHTVPGYQARLIKFKLGNFEQTDRQLLSSIFRETGRSSDVFFSGEPDNARQLKDDLEMLAIIKNQPGYTIPYARLYDSQIQLEEL